MGSGAEGELDWLYARLYCAGGDDTDALLPAVGRWLEGMRRRPIHSAHFLRFVDLRGHHLRLRIHAAPEVLDEAYASLGVLDEAARRAPVGQVERLVADPLTAAGPGRAGFSLAVYGPEYDKYGGEAGVEAAEDHFAASTSWCLEQRIWRVGRPLPRVALAARYMALVAAGLGGDGSDGTDGAGGGDGSGDSDGSAAGWLLGEQLRLWGPRLPAELRGAESLKALVGQVLEVVGQGAAQEPRDGLEDLAADAVAAISRMGAGPAGRRALDLIHIDINRLGLNPAEEAVAGVAARHLLAGRAPSPPG